MNEKRCRWEEYDVSELGRLMIVAGELRGDMDALNFLHPTEDETEALIDARYYAHKLFKILGRLAINAEREWKNVANETQSSQPSPPAREEMRRDGQAQG